MRNDTSSGQAAKGSSTRPESSESASKRSAQNRAAIYATPLPIYVEEAAILYSIAWTLRQSVHALLTLVNLKRTARNYVSRETCISTKLVGHWDEATRSVWIGPKHKKRRRNSDTHANTDRADTQRPSNNSGTGTLEKQSPEDIQINADATAENDMKVLWIKGFFGKGSLSRSEPTWWQREKNRISGEHVLTAEDVTAQRRADRKLHKIQKQKERSDERDKQALALATKQGADSPADPVRGDDSLSRVEQDKDSIHSLRNSIAPESDKPAHQSKGKTKQRDSTNLRQMKALEELGVQVLNQEHVQLQREEAMFLAFGAGVLIVESSVKVDTETEADTPPTHQLTTLQLWQMFAQASLPLPQRWNVFQADTMRPDNPFIISYVTYHHYRSLGWVVRNGIKFCVDWVLYKGADGVVNMRGGAGPVGGHAEFAVVVIPTYEDASDSPTQVVLRARRDWQWLNTVNRVCSGVKKTVILAYVAIPAISRLHRNSNGGFAELTSPACLSLYTVKEVSLKRFIPTRMRD